LTTAEEDDREWLDERVLALYMSHTISEMSQLLGVSRKRLASSIRRLVDRGMMERKPIGYDAVRIKELRRKKDASNK
jgi:DNA-binding MarR family transcriptional regulator